MARTNEELATLLKESATVTRDGTLATEEELAESRAFWSEVYEEAAAALNGSV